MRHRMMILFVLVGTAGPAAAQSAGVPPAPMPPGGGYVRTAGCSDCGPAIGTSKHGMGGGLLGAIKIGGGTVSPIGCSCSAADRTFIFGSCNAFFNPARRCDGSPACGYGSKCGLPVYGSGIPTQGNCYGPFSYLNR